jgi:glycosyltransferase involved in cell wall biosynthesis
MLSIAIVSSRYPSANAPYNHMFVHTRSRQYLTMGVAVRVFVPARVEAGWVIDGVQVSCMPASAIAEAVTGGDFDAVFFHLLHHSVNRKLDGGVVYDRVFAIDMPCLLFIHGIDVQKIATSRAADIRFPQPKSVARFLYRDFWVFARMKRTMHRLLQQTRNARLVCVSDWIRREAETSMGVVMGARVAIIPNGIDTRLFRYRDHWAHRHKLLTIRPLLLKGVSALDLAIETMALLRDPSLTLTIYGQGPEKQQILKYVDALKLSGRVDLQNTFLAHRLIPQIHDQFGIYYATTRMDTQGVSMCEAMSSGLPVVSFATCAIPEFVENGHNGFLITDFDLSQAAAIFDELLSSADTYRRIAENGRASAEKIDVALTCRREIEWVLQATPAPGGA